MDEYADISGKELPETHLLSFKGGIEKIFAKINRIYAVPKKRVIFPSADNINKLKNMIDKLGGIQTCYGGIGINGYVAFNEPEPNVSKTDSRLVYLNNFTITINCIRGGVDGDLIN